MNLFICQWYLIYQQITSINQSIWSKLIKQFNTTNIHQYSLLFFNLFPTISSQNSIENQTINNRWKSSDFWLNKPIDRNNKIVQEHFLFYLLSQINAKQSNCLIQTTLLQSIIQNNPTITKIATISLKRTRESSNKTKRTNKK